MDCGAIHGAAKLGMCVERVKEYREVPQDQEGEVQLALAVGNLQFELAHSEEERKASLVEASHGLSELGAKLAGAEKSFVPWSEVNSAKQRVADLQSTIDTQIDDARQKAEDMEDQQVKSAMPSHEVRTMQQGFVENQERRRKSLTEVSQTLSEISTKLSNAETSWSPWNELNDAKQQVADMRNIVVEQIGTDGPIEKGDQMFGA